jgi:hypothetical protein
MDSLEILKAERDKLIRITKVLDQSIAALSEELPGGRGGAGKVRRKMSAATKAKIATAAKKRWAEKKKGAKS